MAKHCQALRHADHQHGEMLRGELWIVDHQRAALCIVRHEM